jgi:TIR domain-containing protein/BON domain-containing protein
MAHDIFISYASSDKAIADAVCATLEARGVRCWIAPRDIMPGADWGEAIVDAIGGSRVMVLVFSSNANQSANIKREVDRAVTKGVTIIPLRIEDVAPSRALEYYISPIHWLDALTPPLERHLNALADKVTVFLGKAGSDERPPLPRPVLPSGPRRLQAIALAAALLAVGGIGVALWMKAPASPAPETARVPAPPAAPASPVETPPATTPGPIARAPVGREGGRAPETSSRTPEQLQQQILTALKANRLEGLTVEVDPRHNVTMTGTVPDGRVVTTAVSAARSVREVRNVAYRFVVKGSQVAASSRRVETDSPDVLEAQIMNSLNRQGLYGLRVSVDSSLHAHMTGALTDYRRVSSALGALSVRGLKSSSYEIVVASDGSRP